MVPWRRQFAVLLERSFKEQWRNYGVLLTQMVQSVIIAVLVGCVFLQVRCVRLHTLRLHTL